MFHDLNAISAGQAHHPRLQTELPTTVGFYYIEAACLFFPVIAYCKARTQILGESFAFDDLFFPIRGRHTHPADISSLAPAVMDTTRISSPSVTVTYSLKGQTSLRQFKHKSPELLQSSLNANDGNFPAKETPRDPMWSAEQQSVQSSTWQANTARVTPSSPVNRQLPQGRNLWLQLLNGTARLNTPKTEIRVGFRVEFANALDRQTSCEFTAHITTIPSS